MNLETQIVNLFRVFTYFIFVTIILVSGYDVFFKNILFFQEANWAEWFSLALFLCTIAFSYNNFDRFTLALVFNIIALPASVDNLIPSVLISSFNDYKEVYFPIITHIDVFLIFGIIRFSAKTTKKTILQNKAVLLFIIVVLLIVSSIYNIFRLNNFNDTLVILASSYHIRYFLLITLFLYNINHSISSKYIFLGIIYSATFLLLESIIYSQFFLQHKRLISGTLRNNTYANFMAAIAAYLCLLLYKRKASRLFFLGIPILMLSIYLTSTRSALILLFLAILIFAFLELKLLIRPKNHLRFYLYYGIFTFFIALSGFFALNEERLSLSNFKIEKIDFSKSNLNEIIVFENNKFTESLILRLDHFQTSINMIKSQPVFGIGSGRWNISKTKFGSQDRNIMDSHNDFLALASQYGLPASIIMILFIFACPVLLFFKLNDSLIYLLIINIVMMFAGLTNAGLFKHQIFGFLIFLYAINIIKFKKNHT